ncbi:helix-turn-helix transcriptional regulator [Parapusillimonas granuli]|uniref:Helix-turn-helix transcriptional regulator n=1 Tax=Parapusillimonas granuli TaxID=380911 RepID=A0A853G3D7_9BURK|nr:helix-turn-helix transcriptional regulator [Parapusillimonas granuli]MBB5214335.1 transcriptional regulator GlxA family with amidase domain [Parapusillimonas granuli]MEB2399148.1 helix-turn-helix transcriptional regulator [Alcaligenaceae bacterium]NYT51868.1 helix-turn-helix transcriptional regulator [Parapusillimonas granuli]
MNDQMLLVYAKQFLASRLSDPPKLEEVAAVFGVSKYRLTEVFKSSLGTTVAGFLREERMRRAQRLLAQTSLGLEAIARQVGFSCAANFSNAFREYVGVWPSEFRDNAPLEALTSMQGAVRWTSSRP